jgi:hypothetical protein
VRNSGTTWQVSPIADKRSRQTLSGNFEAGAVMEIVFG